MKPVTRFTTLLLLLISEFCFAQFGKTKVDTSRCYDQAQLPVIYKSQMVKVVNEPAEKREMFMPPVYLVHQDSVLLQTGTMTPANAPKLYEVSQQMIELEPAGVQWVTVGYDLPCFSENKEDCAIKQKQNVAAKMKTVKTFTLIKDYSNQPFEVSEWKRINVFETELPSKKEKIDLPANYAYVETSSPISKEEQSDTVQVPCETQTSETMIAAMQQWLKMEGYVIDDKPGKAGGGTLEALTDFQLRHELPVGNVNVPTLEHMGLWPF